MLSQLVEVGPDRVVKCSLMQPVLVLFFEGRWMGGGAGPVVEAAWSVSGATSASCIGSIDIEFLVYGRRMGFVCRRIPMTCRDRPLPVPVAKLESRLIQWRESKVRKGFRRGQCLTHLDRKSPCAKATLCSWCERSPVAWSNVHWRKTQVFERHWASKGKRKSRLKSQHMKGKYEGETKKCQSS